MARPIATTGQPGAPRVTGGKPQKVKPGNLANDVKTVKVKAHTRPAPKPKAAPKAPPKGPLSGLTGGQRAYWEKRLPGASAKSILKARNKQIFNHNPQAFGPGTNLTPNQLKGQVQADTQLQYGDQQNQLNTSLAQVDPVYDAYAKSIAAAQTAAQTAAQQANATITQNAAGLEGQNNTARQALLQQMQQDAAKGGGTVDNSLFANDLAAGASRQQLSNTSANLATQLGANQQGFLAGQGVLGEGARTQRKQSLGDQLTQLKGQKGAFGVKDRAQLIANAQKYGLEQGALGLNQQKAKVTAQQGAAKLKLAGQIAGSNAKLGQERVNATVRGQNINKAIRFGELNQQKQNAATTRQFKSDAQSLSRANFIAKYGITPEQAAQGKHPTRGTPSTSNKISAGSKNTITNVNNALGVIRNLMSGKQPNTHKIRTVLQLPKSKNNPYGGYDHDIVNAAYDLFTFGHLSPANVKALKNLGVQIPKDWLH